MTSVASVTTLIVVIVPWNRYWYYPSFTAEDTEAKGDNVTHSESEAYTRKAADPEFKRRAVCSPEPVF